MGLIEYELSDRGAQMFEWLKEMTASKSDQELIDNAVTILQWAVEQVVRGREIGSFDEANKSYRKVQTSALAPVAKTSKVA